MERVFSGDGTRSVVAIGFAGCGPVESNDFFFSRGFGIGGNSPSTGSPLQQGIGSGNARGRCCRIVFHHGDQDADGDLGMRFGELCDIDGVGILRYRNRRTARSRFCRRAFAPRRIGFFSTGHVAAPLSAMDFGKEKDAPMRRLQHLKFFSLYLTLSSPRIFVKKNPWRNSARRRSRKNIMKDG